MDQLRDTERLEHIREELSDGFDKKELDELEKETQFAIKYADLQRQHRENFIFSHKERREIRHNKLKIERFEHHFLNLSRYITEFENTQNLKDKCHLKELIEVERCELKKLDFIDPISLKEELIFLEQLLKIVSEDEKEELEQNIYSIKNELENEKLLAYLESVDEVSH